MAIFFYKKVLPFIKIYQYIYVRYLNIKKEFRSKLKGKEKAKEAGAMRVEGKDYIVVDGDVMHFRFNV